jgi:DNA-binding NarL/FixJ family response regulator
VSQGRTNREIAEELVIEAGVVANYVRAIFQRLGLRNRVQLAAWWATQVHDEG